MSQANGPTSHGIRFWMLLPLRMFLHGARYVFGHPLPFIVVFSLIGLRRGSESAIFGSHARAKNAGL
jgi:hypothetical protein